MSKTDHVLYTLHQSKMVQVGQPTPIKGLTNKEVAEKANFVIVCEHGDWSGFRTLQGCINQFDELEASGRKDGYYWVVERF